MFHGGLQFSEVTLQTKTLAATLLQAIADVHQEEHCRPSERNLNEAWLFFNSDLSSSRPHVQQRVESMKAALKANSKLMSFRFYAAYMCLQVEEFQQNHHVPLDDAGVFDGGEDHGPAALRHLLA